MKNSNNIMVVQGGGPTQVFNATLVALIEEAVRAGSFDEIFGACFGTAGLTTGKFANLKRLTNRELGQLRLTPGAALGSSRFRPSGEDMERILDSLKRMGIRNLLFIGGNGTMHGAEQIHKYCHEACYPIQVIGIPKTIDNDIAGTDRCPGYASAARFIAQSTRDLGMDIRSLPQPVTILETMGRSVGWVAAASALGKQDAKDAPHVICIPEVPFSIDEFTGVIEEAVAKQGWAVAVVSEGIRDATGQLVYQKTDPAQADPLNRPITGGVGEYLADQVAARLRMRCRCEKPGLLGRSSMLHVSQMDLEDAALVGRTAVEGLSSGRSGEMVSLLPRKQESSERVKFVAFEEIAGIERTLPSAWVCEGDAVPFKRAFFEYAAPLVGELHAYHPQLISDVQIQGVLRYAK